MVGRRTNGKEDDSAMQVALMSRVTPCLATEVDIPLATMSPGMLHLQLGLLRAWLGRQLILQTVRYDHRISVIII